MVRRVRAGQARVQLGGSLLLACLLGLVLLLGHQLIMVTTDHADAMVMAREPVRGAVGANPMAEGQAASPSKRRPLTGWEACFSQEGLLPALLVLLALIGVWSRRGSGTLGGATPPTRHTSPRVV